jgi:hypothetical protein
MQIAPEQLMSSARFDAVKLTRMSQSGDNGGGESCADELAARDSGIGFFAGHGFEGMAVMLVDE